MGAPARIEHGREEREHAHALWAVERGGCEGELGAVSAVQLRPPPTRLDCLIGPGGVCRPVQTAGASSTCEPNPYAPPRPLRPPGARTGLTHPCPKRTIPRPCQELPRPRRAAPAVVDRRPRGAYAHSRNALLDLPTPQHHWGRAGSGAAALAQ